MKQDKALPQADGDSTAATGKWTAEAHPNPNFGWNIYAPDTSEYAEEGALILVASSVVHSLVPQILLAVNSHADLLAALKRTARNGHYNECLAGQRGHGQCSATCDVVRDAIALAEGRR